MKIIFDDGPLICDSCGGEAVDEQDLYLGSDQVNTVQIGGVDAYSAGDPILSSSLFYPAMAFCGLCLLTKVQTVDGPWHSVSVGGQS